LQRGELVRLGATARDDSAMVARHDERAPVLVDAGGRERVGHQQRLDRADVRRGRRGDGDVRHCGEDSKRKGRATRGLSSTTTR
jgi:hypothetical protein